MVMTTSNFYGGDNQQGEKEVDQKRAKIALSQLFGILEQCQIGEVVKPEYVALQQAIKKAISERK